MLPYTVTSDTSSSPGLNKRIPILTDRVNIENTISITLSNTIATNIHSDRMVSLCWWCCSCSSIRPRISTIRSNRSSCRFDGCSFDDVASTMLDNPELSICDGRNTWILLALKLHSLSTVYSLGNCDSLCCYKGIKEVLTLLYLQPSWTLQRRMISLTVGV